MKLATFFISSTRPIFTKALAASEGSIKIDLRFQLDTFRNVAYFSSYLQTKTFAW